MTKRKVCIIIIAGVSLLLAFNYTVQAKEKSVSSNDTGNLNIIESPQLRQFDDIDHMCNYITKKFFKNRLEYYIQKKIEDSQYVLGPNIGDSITLKNVLPLSQSNIQIGQESFDLQPNITIWGGSWYGVTRDEAQVPGFTDFAMAVEKRSNSDTSYSNLNIVSGSLDQPGINVSGSDTSIIITRTSTVDSSVTSSSGNVSVSAKFTNNYGTASNAGTTFGGSTSDWYTSDASENSFNDSIALALKVPLISVFKAEVKNDNEELELGTTFSENPQNFYNITENPNSSETTAIWKTTPNMNKEGIQTAVLQVTNTSKGYKQIKELNVNFDIKNPLKLIVPSDSDFGTYKLGSSNSVLNWNKSSKVEVEGADSSRWDLSVALNAKSSLKGYIKIGDQTISEQPQEVISGTGS
ncbi:hypothetical protein, partial [Lactococcus lactis]|uniref:hypothetical protein n=1 Tax=Lactococcus lactis TaxID=1358 RepID=UPI0022E44FA3